MSEYDGISYSIHFSPLSIVSNAVHICTNLDPSLAWYMVSDVCSSYGTTLGYP